SRIGVCYCKHVPKRRKRNKHSQASPHKLSWPKYLFEKFRCNSYASILKLFVRARRKIRNVCKYIENCNGSERHESAALERLFGLIRRTLDFGKDIVCILPALEGIQNTEHSSSIVPRRPRISIRFERVLEVLGAVGVSGTASTHAGAAKCCEPGNHHEREKDKLVQCQEVVHYDAHFPAEEVDETD